MTRAAETRVKITSGNDKKGARSGAFHIKRL
jgi:hypothetical protein